MLACPKSTAPARRRLSTTGASFCALPAVSTALPAGVGSPSTSMLLDNTNGTLASGPTCTAAGSACAARARAAVAAASDARTPSTVKPLCMALWNFTRLSKRFSSSSWIASACALLPRTASAIPAHPSSVAAGADMLAPNPHVRAKRLRGGEIDVRTQRRFFHWQPLLEALRAPCSRAAASCAALVFVAEPAPPRARCLACRLRQTRWGDAGAAGRAARWRPRAICCRWA